MKTIRYTIVSILLLSSLNSYSQTGYLGRRWHFQMDARLSNAYLNPHYGGSTKDEDAKNEWYKFNVFYLPSIEYVLSENWSLGLSYQFMNLDYMPNELSLSTYTKTGDFLYEEKIRYFSPISGKISAKGFGLYVKGYTSSKAPLGYYYKFQFDYLKFNSITEYTCTEPQENIGEKLSRNDDDWALGFRIEFGKTIFLNNYLSLGTGLSCGLLTKGYGEKNYSDLPMNTYDNFYSNLPIDDAAKCLLYNYFFGVNISLGVIPF